jgi:hypothetical protein
VLEEGPRIHGFKVKNSIDHIVKHIIQMGPNFISPESVKNIVYVGKKINKSKSRYDLLKIAKRKREGKFGLLGHLGVKSLL